MARPTSLEVEGPRHGEGEGATGIPGGFPCPDGDAQIERTIFDLPDELLLSIFERLENQDIVFSVAKVCVRWEKLASDPGIWKKRFVFYNPDNPGAFTRTVTIATSQIKYLHLGSHVAMEEQAFQALLSSNVTVVKQLSFLGSCRTNPSKVIEILKKFGSNLETLTLCVNDELVSFGSDEKTCYAFNDAHIRPGIFFNLMGQMVNLRHLALHGGFCSRWYFGELLESPGCSKIDTLDLKEFEQIYGELRSIGNVDFAQTLISKNKDHLRFLKVSAPIASYVSFQKCVQKRLKSLEKLSINVKQFIGFHTTSLKFLELSGKSLYDGELEQIFNICHDGDLLHRIKELNVIQFSTIEEGMFCKLAKLLTGIKTLRIDGGWLTSENISLISNNLPFLESICVRNTPTVAEKHMVSICFPLSILNDIDMDETLDMDCTYVAMKFQTFPHLNYSVIGTGCKCFMFNVGSNSEFNFAHVSEATTPETRKIVLSLSNNLDIEFLPKFWKYCENDVAFHFDHTVNFGQDL